MKENLPLKPTLSHPADTSAGCPTESAADVDARCCPDAIRSRCEEEVQAGSDRRTFLEYAPHGPAVKTAKSHMKENSALAAPSYQSGRG